MKPAIWIIFLFSILSSLVSCKQEIDPYFPLIFTGDVSDIRKEGAVFNAKITELSNHEIIGYGFVWDSNTMPEIEKSEKVLIYGAPKTGNISDTISTCLRPGVRYYVRAFIRNSEYTTYGNEVTFVSLGSIAPQIKDFMPKTGNFNDTILIIGKNFSYIINNNKVYFENFPATVINASQDSLWVKVPANLHSSTFHISVTILGNQTLSPDSFGLIPPVITDFYDKIGPARSLVTIVGMNFLESPETIKVYFNNFEAEVVSITDRILTAIVPDSINQRWSTINVKMNNLADSSVEKFRLAPLSVIDFSPKIACTGNTLTLTGNNFSIIPQNNIVKIGGLTAIVEESSMDILKVRLPLQNIGYYDSRTVKVNVEVLGENYDFNETLLINDKWFRLKDSPINFTGAFCVVNDNKAYLGLNESGGFWTYDPVNDTFRKLADFPGPLRQKGNGFVLDYRIYFGTGSNDSGNLRDIWEYNIFSDIWQRKSDFPGESRMGSVTFSINGNGYLGGGVKNQGASYPHPFDDFWKYNASNDSWSRIPTFNAARDSSSVYGMADGISVVAGNLAYIGLGWNRIAGDAYIKRWFEYSPLTNSWRRRADFPVAIRYSLGPIAFSLGDKPNVKTIASDFYSYNSSNNTWEIVVTDILPDNISGKGFSIGDIAYVGIGRALWEYDPSR